MTRFIWMICAVLTIGLAGCAPVMTEVEPRSAFNIGGASVLSPNQAGWRVIQARPDMVAFGREGPSERATVVAAASVFRVGVAGSDNQFLDYIAEQRVKQDDASRFDILEVKNRKVNYKGTRCLRYRGVSRDNKSPVALPGGVQFTKVDGYICRHPARKDLAVQMEISERSDSKVFPAALRAVADGFFAGVTLNRNGL